MGTVVPQACVTFFDFLDPMSNTDYHQLRYPCRGNSVRESIDPVALFVLRFFRLRAENLLRTQAIILLCVGTSSLLGAQALQHVCAKRDTGASFRFMPLKQRSPEFVSPEAPPKTPEPVTNLPLKIRSAHFGGNPRLH